jgi:hypothetical protein
MSIAHVVRLIPRAGYAAARAAEPKVEIGPGLGTPYAAERTLLTSIFGIPCNAPPWGTLTAVDLTSGAFLWQIPLGSTAMGFIRGLPNLGGPIVTATGLVFIAASRDDKLRRLRRLDRQGTLAGVAAGRRSGNADELRRRRSAVRRRRCRRPFQIGQHARRYRHRFLSAARHWKSHNTLARRPARSRPTFPSPPSGSARSPTLAAERLGNYRPPCNGAP